MNFIVALFTDTSTELMSGAKSREWVHHNPTNQPRAALKCQSLIKNCLTVVFFLTLPPTLLKT